MKLTRMLENQEDRAYHNIHSLEEVIQALSNKFRSLWSLKMVFTYGNAFCL